MSDLKIWLNEVRSQPMNPPVVDIEKHVPTDGELNNALFLTMKYVINWEMREADFAVVKMLAGPIESVADFRDKFAYAAAEYMWDHILGEPDDVEVKDLADAVVFFIDAIYTMDEYTRNETKKTVD